LICENILVGSAPNSHPPPLGEISQPSTSSGSLHMRSAYAPSCGISYFLGITLIESIDFKSGDRPPWIHRIDPSIIAANGK